MENNLYAGTAARDLGWGAGAGDDLLVPRDILTRCTRVALVAGSKRQQRCQANQSLKNELTWLSSEVALVLLTPGSILTVPDDFFLYEIYSLNVAEVHQQRWCEESGQ